MIPLLLLASLLSPADVTLDDLAADTAPPGAIWAETLDLAAMDQEWGSPRAGRSVEDHPLWIGEREFRHGIGSHANAELEIELGGAALSFHAAVGVDAEVGERGSVAFVVWVDGKEAARTAVLRGGEPPRLLAVDLAGARAMTLLVEGGGDHIHYDHADWGGAAIVLAPAATARPRTIRAPDDPVPNIVHPQPREPRIHAPRITGATPGRPFLFRIPATGEEPLVFAARGLPAGLVLDPDTGILSGALAAAGSTEVELTVHGAAGETASTLTIVGGPRALALTPPMGWNSWNVWGTAVDDAKVRAAADALVASGLAACGYQYVNIDDAWEGKRDESGRIQTNEKFPDMRSLADYVHAKGLKLGIYSSPGLKTCAGHEGSYTHEEQDARTWAEWGIDYLKYDWCSYGGIAAGDSLPELKKPYEVMRKALDACGRDIVYSLCQYGMGRVSEWGAEVGGNTWRTTGDITDSWSSLAGIGFAQNGLEPFAGPGRWNDPDMLVVGKVGWGPALRATSLTPNEQITHLTLWSLLAAPLLIGCDLTQLDEFTLALLTNPEVLEVSQDPLGVQARRVAQDGTSEVWMRPLADGTRAVGLFNRGRRAAEVTATWSAIGASGPQPVRDFWRHEDRGTHESSFRAEVPRHGAVLVRIGRPSE
ncbi:MAG: NPCBM/NEW2 domain-containing protein [Planctomycetota bacterium]